jgi:Ni,Fe-hydrogenase I cytochrome b subunit
MNALKKYLGIVWIALGPAALFFLIRTAIAEISRNPALNTAIQWGIFVLIFIPIAIGLVLFGYYAWKGEYYNTED